MLNVKDKKVGYLPYLELSKNLSVLNYVTEISFNFFFFFLQLNEKFKEEDNPSILYAISMSWFKDWENFVRGKTDSKFGKGKNIYKTITTTKMTKCQHRTAQLQGSLLKTVICRRAIKEPSVMLDSLSCSFTSISFLTTSCSFTLICVLV